MDSSLPCLSASKMATLRSETPPGTSNKKLWFHIGSLPPSTKLNIARKSLGLTRTLDTHHMNMVYYRNMIKIKSKIKNQTRFLSGVPWMVRVRWWRSLPQDRRTYGSDLPAEKLDERPVGITQCISGSGINYIMREQNFTMYIYKKFRIAKEVWYVCMEYLPTVSKEDGTSLPSGNSTFKIWSTKKMESHVNY